MERFKGLLLVIWTVMAVALVGFASEGGLGDGVFEAPETLEGFLLLLTTGVGIGAATAVIFEKVPYVDTWFKALDFAQKRLVVMLTCFILPISATGALVLFGYRVYNIEDVYIALVAGFVAYLASQITHLPYSSQT